MSEDEMTQKPKDDTTQKPKIVLVGEGRCDGLGGIIRDMLLERGYEVDILDSPALDIPSVKDLCVGPERITLEELESIKESIQKEKPPAFKRRHYKKR